MGFTEDEFYRTPMETDDKTWLDVNYPKRNASAHSLPRGRRGLPPRPVNTIDEFEMVSGQYYSDLLRVLVQKQKDYGPLNISLAPGGAINGLLVRMNDKMQRLINLTYKPDQTPNNEAIRDSYSDLANYCIISMMVLDGVWEGIPND